MFVLVTSVALGSLFGAGCAEHRSMGPPPSQNTALVTTTAPPPELAVTATTTADAAPASPEKKADRDWIAAVRLERWAEAAEKIRPRPHPDDAMLWRRIGLLRQEMLGEQLLFGAVAEHAAAVRRGTFLRDRRGRRHRGRTDRGL